MVDERIIAKRDDFNPSDVETVEKPDDETEVSKHHLQEEMSSARESISQTIGEIADTVSTQAQAIRDTVTRTLDWREHAREHPGAVTIGALAVGFVVGYGVVSATFGKRTNNAKGNGKAHKRASEHYATNKTSTFVGDNRPGFLDKVTKTHAYKKLSSEAGNLANQFIDEMVNVGKTVLLPAAVNKITDTVRAGFANEKTLSKNKSMSMNKTDNVNTSVKQETNN